MIQSLAPRSLPAIRCGNVVPDSQLAEVMSDRSSLRVVVVDDSYDANAAFSRLLEKSGFAVAGRAYDGISGLKVIKDTSPDVAILDIAMPRMKV
jgi:response regulator RpfG family c-di-GMP phosphodiesterase